MRSTCIAATALAAVLVMGGCSRLGHELVSVKDAPAPTSHERFASLDNDEPVADRRRPAIASVTRTRASSSVADVVSTPRVADTVERFAADPATTASMSPLLPGTPRPDDEFQKLTLLLQRGVTAGRPICTGC